ncbi:hypothetical protein AAMO2058_001209500 [Amorphochlora amoebiformis]
MRFMIQVLLFPVLAAATWKTSSQNVLQSAQTRSNLSASTFGAELKDSDVCGELMKWNYQPSHTSDHRLVILAGPSSQKDSIGEILVSQGLNVGYQVLDIPIHPNTTEHHAVLEVIKDYTTKLQKVANIIQDFHSQAPKTPEERALPPLSKMAEESIHSRIVKCMVPEDNLLTIDPELSSLETASIIDTFLRDAEDHFNGDIEVDSKITHTNQAQAQEQHTLRGLKETLRTFSFPACALLSHLSEPTLTPPNNDYNVIIDWSNASGLYKRRHFYMNSTADRSGRIPHISPERHFNANPVDYGDPRNSYVSGKSPNSLQGFQGDPGDVCDRDSP